MINGALLLQSLPAMLKAGSVSVLITLISFIVGIMGGIAIMLGRLYGPSWIQYVLALYVNIVRGTPVMVQITFLYYSLPMLGFKIAPIICVIIALGLCSATYLSETIRAGVLAVPKGYFEAAYTLGFSRWQTARYVIFPHVIRTILPSIGNELVTLSKDSSLASIIGVVELFKKTQDIARLSYDYITMMAGLALVYIVWTSIISYVFNRLEKKLSK